jgi:hypothetical protein
MPRKGRRRRSTRPVPTPAPRTAPLVAATALAGVLGCGPRHDRPVPPQVVEPDPSEQQPPVMEVDAGPPDSAPMAPADEPEPVPPQVPPKPPQPRPE